MGLQKRNMLFSIGKPNDGFAQYFIGQSNLAPVSSEQVGIFNVTFEPVCRNNWHTHHAASGGGQILICVGGRGYYQEWGKEAGGHDESKKNYKKDSRCANDSRIAFSNGVSVLGRAVS